MPRLRPFSFGSGRAPGQAVVMTDLLDFVALSLLPSRCRWRVAERLRAGDPPGGVLQELADWSDNPDTASILRSRAYAALRRAEAHAITAIPWSDPVYPAALTTIADPPPVLWTRGRVAALSVPAVAIVGSRAASPYALSVADKLAGDLAACGLAVVSGPALGGDS